MINHSKSILLAAEPNMHLVYGLSNMYNIAHDKIKK